VSKKSRLVCIHDGARPLVEPGWIKQLVQSLNGTDGVVWGRNAVPTVKLFDPVTGEIKRTLKRSELFEAETPQLFKRTSLIKAYQALKERALQATDDASLIEATGGKVKAVTHSNLNIKVTTPQDLKVVKAVLGSGESNLKFGLGFDRHRLIPKRAFYLGGLRIPSKVGPVGHSDGDPLLHAITDAILGAIGAGDIGDFFPDTNKRWKNVKSTVFLKEAVKQAEKLGFRPIQVDTTIILERPKLGPWKKKIQAHLSKLLSVARDSVSVKAKTAEGFGPEGEGLAVSAQALVVLSSQG
jgi:2-C-methyl-D-erythritol 2,4-cyclodiphosphate synthase